MKTTFTCLLCLLTISFGFSQGVPLPYSSGFDSNNEKAGWQQFRKGFLSTYSWTYAAAGFNASTCVSHDYNVGGNASDTVVDWFVSPAINFATASLLSVKVKTGGFSTPIPDNFEVYFGTGNPDPALGNFTLIANLSDMQPQYQWLDTIISISHTSDSGYIAFKYKTIGSAWSTYAFDNVSASAEPLSVKKNTEKITLSSYPNPFADETVLQPTCPLKNATLMLYDIQGKVVREWNNLNGQSFHLKADGLTNGLYFIQITEGNLLIAKDKLILAN